MSEKGFTLTELLMVIVLIGIVGASVAPLLSDTTFFQKRFFLDEFSNMLRFAHKISTATGCDIVIKYKDNNHIGLYMKQNCTQGDFTRPIVSPYLIEAGSAYELVVPKIPPLVNLPIFIDKMGKVYNAQNRWQPEIVFSVDNQHIVIDGFSGFVYEKTT
ncbi:MAG: prepilin-type N-terminal cleavage/methylation domain-containing protein [Proteobacteria bacterium]|nr:prepilin-type N-terminal cleavage/methylation domain-containing protein [Pseudomonadota bacterium]